MRTTAADVKQIIETTLTDPNIESYILSANLLVTSVLGDDSASPIPLYTEIERWLTAHMIASTKERFARKEEAGGAKIEYMGKDGLGLQSTPFGQMVLTLDTSGNFALQDGSKKKAKWTSVKTE